jgi:hypothetical protein
MPKLNEFWSFVQTQIVPMLASWGSKIGDVQGNLNNLKTFIDTQVMPKLQSLWSFIQTYILPTFQSLGDIIPKDVLPHFDDFKTSTDHLTGSLGHLWNALSPTLGPALTGIGALIAVPLLGLWDGLKTAIDLVGWAINHAIDGFNKSMDSMARWIDWIAKGIEWVNGLGKKINDTVAAAVHWGEDLIKNIVTGIQNQLGNLETQVGKVAQAIAGPLAHSKPETGPLADDDQWGAHFVDNIVQGIQSQMGALRGVAINAASTLTVAAPSSSFSGSQGTFGGGSNDQQNTHLLQQIAQDIHTIAQREGSGNLTMNNAFAPGSQNAQQIAQTLQSIFGYNYEGIARGAF